MKKSHRYISFLVLAVAAALTSGCELSDPGCVSDTECRQGRLCVEGACTGEVTGQNNGATNNGVFNNGDTNNGVFNNGDTNNGVFNNGDPNNENNENNINNFSNNGIFLACRSAQDCEPGEEVCSWADDTRALACVDDWTCDSFDGDGSEEDCVLRWSCDERDQLGVECSGLDDGSANCLCFDATGPIAEFAAEPGVCGGEYNLLVDAANIACGFRIPLLTF